MDLLPLFMAVKDRPVLVVGGGKAAARKAELASRAGAAVTVLAPEISGDMATLIAERKLSHVTHEVTREDLDGCVLAWPLTVA